jgi:hypothetical protein
LSGVGRDVYAAVAEELSTVRGERKGIVGVGAELVKGRGHVK